MLSKTSWICFSLQAGRYATNGEKPLRGTVCFFDRAAVQYHGLINKFYTGKTCLRWLDWIFLGGYLPSLNINYFTMSKDMEKRFPQLYYIKMKNYYDLSFIAIGVPMAT